MAAILSLFLFAASIAAQSVHQVNVGDNGLFFDPQTVTAATGDIISFNFVGKNHSVTQSSQDAPCTPLTGGFNSGLLGVGSDTSAPPGVWNLTITDASQPIWYFCEAVVPVSHCANGMVGAINPPSNDSFNAFQSAAKNITETITASDVAVLTGVGAAATALPTTTATVPANSTSSGSGTSTGTSSTGTHSATNTSSGSLSSSLSPWLWDIALASIVFAVVVLI